MSTQSLNANAALTNALVQYKQCSNGINDILRHDLLSADFSKCSKEMKNYCKFARTLSEVFKTNKRPPYRGGPLYRGVETDIFKNNLVFIPTFLSTTTSYDVAKRYAGENGVVYKIEKVPDGIGCIEIERVLKLNGIDAPSSTEREVLLQNGLLLEKKDTITESGKGVVIIITLQIATKEHKKYANSSSINQQTQPQERPRPFIPDKESQFTKAIIEEFQILQDLGCECSVIDDIVNIDVYGKIWALYENPVPSDESERKQIVEGVMNNYLSASGGAPQRYLYKKRYYKVHTGKRGGRFIISKGRKKYL